MLVRNKVKFQMYNFLVMFNKCNSIEKTRKDFCKKFKFNDNDNNFEFVVSQCLDNNFLSGITYSTSVSNNYYLVYSENIYITYTGFEFLKNYYSFLKKILWNLFIIITTAVITVIANNKLSNSNQKIDTTNKVISQDSTCCVVCNDSNN